MTKYEAKKVLQAIAQKFDRNLIETREGRTISAHVEFDEAYLEGHFRLEELEAIAMWMRDPAGVVEAKEDGN